MEIGELKIKTPTGGPRQKWNKSAILTVIVMKRLFLNPHNNHPPCSSNVGSFQATRFRQFWEFPKPQRHFGYIDFKSFRHKNVFSHGSNAYSIINYECFYLCIRFNLYDTNFSLNSHSNGFFGDLFPEVGSILATLASLIASSACRKPPMSPRPARC